MGLSKHGSKKKERKKEGEDVYSQATKNIAREKTGRFHMEKGTEVL